MTREVDVLVVGAGPAGLTAAARLARAGVARVEVLERDPQAGGVPRYCAHGGFGTWPHPLGGPRLARGLVREAARAGAVVRTGVTALDWAGPLALTTVGARGTETIRARAIVLATGARERSRAARLVPGTRPAGVYTAGELQQAVHLFGQPIGTRAVVVGAADVSYGAAATVRAAGATVVAMVTDRERAEAAPARAAAARLLRGVPLLTGTTVAELLGHGRLSAVRVRHRDGRPALLSCDTVVFTGDFVPDDELARRGGPRPGVFAAGGLVHPGQHGSAAARAGERTADAVLARWGG